MPSTLTYVGVKYLFCEQKRSPRWGSLVCCLRDARDAHHLVVLRPGALGVARDGEFRATHEDSRELARLRGLAKRDHGASALPEQLVRIEARDSCEPLGAQEEGAELREERDRLATRCTFVLVELHPVLCSRDEAVRNRPATGIREERIALEGATLEVGDEGIDHRRVVVVLRDHNCKSRDFLEGRGLHDGRVLEFALGQGLEQRRGHRPHGSNFGGRCGLLTHDYLLALLVADSHFSARCK